MSILEHLHVLAFTSTIMLLTMNYSSRAWNWFLDRLEGKR